MQNTPKEKIKNLIFQAAILAILFSATIYNCFKRDITIDPTEAVSILTIFTICTGTYFLIRFHLIAEEELTQQKISRLWITIPLLTTGLYISATTFIIQLTDNPEIIKKIQFMQPYHKEILTTFLIWLILVSVSIISTHQKSKKGDKQKMEQKPRSPQEKHLYQCTLRFKETGNVFHFIVVAWDEIQLIRLAQQRYRQIGVLELINLVGEKNIIFESKYPNTPPMPKTYPDFSELEFKYFDRGRGTDDDFIMESKWPEEIEADPESPYADKVKTL